MSFRDSRVLLCLATGLCMAVEVRGDSGEDAGLTVGRVDQVLATSFRAANREREELENFRLQPEIDDFMETREAFHLVE